MYDRILVALDGSDLAERVLPYVEALAERFGSAVTLLQAATPPGMLMAGTAGADLGGVVDPTPILDAERQDIETYLAAVADRLRRKGVATEYERPEGRAAETVVQRARDLAADLIAMTTHGRGGLGRLVLGSVADEVLRSAPCPILLVRVSEGASPQA